MAACGCGDDGQVESDEEARVAYLGIDRGVDRAIELGFDGFNAATSANIPVQSAPGDLAGTMTVAGQVDQGNSANKEMRLEVSLDDYADVLVDGDLEVHYFTTAPVDLDLSMKGLPDADLTGTMVGRLDMLGAIEGVLDLSLSITGQTEADANGTIRRKPGSVHVTGTATSEHGIYQVDITR